MSTDMDNEKKSNQPAELEQTKKQDFNQRLQDEIKSFLEESLHVPEVEFRRLMELFLELHDCVNDPQTRKEMAVVKANLVEKLALEQLKQRSDSNWKIERLTAPHLESGIETHNVVVTIGDPKTGPNTVVLVHHDVISVGEDNKVDDEIPLEITDGGLIKGRTIADDSIHLATMIQSLAKLQKPDSGAITIVFTDHEENGCFGSRAIKDKIRDRMSVGKPVAVCALESTQKSPQDSEKIEIGVGHRGKLDTQIKIDEEIVSLTKTFFDFFNALRRTQKRAHAEKDERLGRTSGTSTCGFIRRLSMWAKIDFRTNRSQTPENVFNDLVTNLENEGNAQDSDNQFEIASMFAVVLYQLKENIVTFTVTDNGIQITSETQFLHPSTLDPNKDETTLPTVYMLLKLLEDMGEVEKVQSITWGETSKQNSNPTTATIGGQFSVTQEQLLALLETWRTDTKKLFKLAEYEKTPPTKFATYNTVKTGAVMVGENKVTKEVLESMGADPTILQFMTDAGPIFSAMKNAGIKVFPFIFGVGDRKLLHGVEELSLQQIAWFMNALPKFIGTVQVALSKAD